jgi:hypothetical protein
VEYTFTYTNPSGKVQTFISHKHEDARNEAQVAFFEDYKAGNWAGKSTDDAINEVQSEELDAHDQFMQDVCNDDAPTEEDVEDMASDYEQTNDAMDAVSEDMNPVQPPTTFLSALNSAKKDEPEEGKTYALTSDGTTPSIANGDSWSESVVEEPAPTFLGGWGSGANGVSNHGDKRTVDYNTVSQVAVERQKNHDTWLAEIGLSRPPENISITKAGYKRGTAVVDLGYDNLAAARAVWDEKPDAYVATTQFMDLIASENREDMDFTLSSLRMNDDGMLQTTWGDLALEEHGLKQLLAATQQGSGTDMHSSGPLFPRGFHTMKSLDPDVRAYVFNEHMKRHCSHDKSMKFRTRIAGGVRSIFGVVGQGYQSYDADQVANMIRMAVDDMPYKAEIQYNAATTNLTMDVTMHAPEDLTDFSAGDLYEVGFRFKSNDRGGGSINGSAIAFWNECLNMIILHSEKAEIMRAIHKGNMQEKMEAIRKGMDAARPAMERFAQDWGILAQTASVSAVSSQDMDDYGFEGANGSQILIKKLVAEGKVASGIGRDAAIQMMFDSYADQGGGDSVQDVINAITRMAHQNLVNDCARDTLEREAGLLVPVLAAQA